MVVENLLTSLRTDGDKITIIDQLLLPHQEKWIEIDSIEAAYDAIKTMKASANPMYALDLNIRGAPAIASLAALSLASHLSIALKSDPQPAFLASPAALKEHIVPQLSYLYSSRPTAVNLGAATKRLQNTLQAGIDAEHKPTDIATALVQEGRLIADEDFGRNREMSKHGAEWLVQRIKSQGGEGVNLNVMTLTTAVGADRVARNGDTANKVGTYNAAVLAARHNIPFIVVAPVSTVDLDTPDGSQ
ncbi:S-methyl-5-thioribose-1-phosphate isomerase [Ceratobasidium sp. 414]|nr:S-methyl-5-thioribose-1-phosphate isomerase [Ceratobasidium sp. 414]